MAENILRTNAFLTDIGNESTGTDSPVLSDDAPMYDPYTQMFSDNPYDLVTGEFIPEKKEPPRPVIERQFETKKKFVALCVMIVLTIPLVVMAHLAFANLDGATETFVYDNTRSLLGLSFLGACIVAVVTPLIIKYNNTLGAKANRQIEGKIMLMAFPASLLSASLITPWFSYVGNVICIILIILAYAGFIFFFSKKFSSVSKIISVVLLSIMTAICFCSSNYEKLLLHPVDLGYEYIIMTRRAPEQLPAETDKVSFLSVSQCNFYQFGYSAQHISTYEDYQELIRPMTEEDIAGRIVSNPERASSINEFDQMLVGILSERSAVYDRKFFEEHDLNINFLPLYAETNTISITDVSMCKHTIDFTRNIGFTEKVKDRFYPDDIAIEFIILPDGSFASETYLHPQKDNEYVI